MPLPDLLRLAETALCGQSSSQLPEDVLRIVVEETSTRAGELLRGREIVTRWPRIVSRQPVEDVDRWMEVEVGGGDSQWTLRLLHAERIDESILTATRLVLRAWDFRKELKRTRFDERFHLWELEAIRTVATNIGAIEECSQLANEIIDHLVALLGVRTARLYLGPNPSELICVGRFGPQVLTDDELEVAWESGIARDEVVALPLKSTSGVLGLLVAANKEARAGTEPLADNDVRLLELFAIQVTVALEYARLTKESLERERLRRELEVAAVIQGHLYPQKFPDFPGFHLAARSTSSLHVAGDTYDVLLRSGVLVVTITDVSGKGVGAGMIASGVQAGVRLLADADLPLEELAQRINVYLEGATASNRFATFAMIRLWPDGRMSAVNAGHCPVLVRRCNGDIEQIVSTGLPLGILKNAHYTEESVVLEPGDLVVLYTDGLTEAEDPDEEEFGVTRVSEVVAGVSRPDADSVCDTLLEAVHAHACGRPLADDATLLVVERLLEG